MEMTLNLPRNYVEIEEEEMRYLDGGITTYNNWWGTSTRFTKSDCRNLSYATTLGGIMAAVPLPYLSAAFGVITLGLQIGADNNGFYLNRLWNTKAYWISW